MRSIRHLNMGLLHASRGPGRHRSTIVVCRGCGNLPSGLCTCGPIRVEYVQPEENWVPTPRGQTETFFRGMDDSKLLESVSLLDDEDYP